MDRVIQQVIAQILMPLYESLFSDNSSGFRSNRGCHDTFCKVQEIVNKGNVWVASLDLEKSSIR